MKYSVLNRIRTVLAILTILSAVMALARLIPVFVVVILAIVGSTLSLYIEHSKKNRDKN